MTALPSLPPNAITDRDQRLLLGAWQGKIERPNLVHRWATATVTATPVATPGTFLYPESDRNWLVNERQ